MNTEARAVYRRRLALGILRQYIHRMPESAFRRRSLFRREPVVQLTVEQAAELIEMALRAQERIQR